MGRVAFIPARLGSKGVPLKNLQHVGGASLVRRITLKAISTGEFDHVIVSSDSDRILEEVSDLQVICHLRAKYAASDSSTASQVILEYLNSSSGIKNVTPETLFCYLQPTSPFTTPVTIKSIIELSEIRKLPVITIMSASKHPDKSLRLEESGVVSPYLSHSAPTSNRQSLLPIFYPTGGIYCFTLYDFMKVNDVPVAGAVGFHVDFPEYLDVDTSADLTIAQYLANAQ